MPRAPRTPHPERELPRSSCQPSSKGLGLFPPVLWLNHHSGQTWRALHGSGVLFVGCTLAPKGQSLRPRADLPHPASSGARVHIGHFAVFSVASLPTRRGLCTFSSDLQTEPRETSTSWKHIPLSVPALGRWKESLEVPERFASSSFRKDTKASSI